MSCSLYGLKIGVRVSDPSALTHVRALLPPACKQERFELVDRLYSLVLGGTDRNCATVKRFHIAYADGLRLSRSLELERTLEDLDSDLGRFVSVSAKDVFFVHAGVVAWRGRAIVIPGASFTGKSSLVAGLVRSGATYCSDEYAVVDSEGQVHAYRNALSLRSSNRGPSKRVSAEALGATDTMAPLPIGLIAVTQYRKGARWKPRVLSRGGALMALVSNTIAIRERPQPTLSVLAKAVIPATALEGERGDADIVAPALLSALRKI